MPKLVLSMDGLVLKEMPLGKERTTIGRKPDNDIQIDNLAISGHHAVITCITNDAFLEDRNSTNGTYLNGQPVKKNVLRNNDVIELGKYKIKFLADDAKPGLSASEMIETAALAPFEMPVSAPRTIGGGIEVGQIGAVREAPEGPGPTRSWPTPCAFCAGRPSRRGAWPARARSRARAGRRTSGAVSSRRGNSSGPRRRPAGRGRRGSPRRSPPPP